MGLYQIALFLHIVGAMLLFVIMTVEGFSLRLGRSSARFGQIVGPISAVLVLFPGLYMMATTWGWKGWIGVGITGWVMVAVAAAITGVLLARGRVSPRSAGISWATRLGMTVGIVFIMSVKPDLAASVLAVLLGAAAGAASGVVTARRLEVAP